MRTVAPSDHRTVGPRASAIAASYAVIAVVMTWPVARDLSSRIAGDLADPVFNTWVLMWTSGQVLAFLGGDWTALGQYWHGNIFYPERYTLAYSEHLTPQMLQALPVLAITDNSVAAYNLLFLSTFVLSGLGVYLFVRDLTGLALPAFVAGLAFAWAPYRLAQVPHLQVLTAYWMPLALVGFHRYFDSRRVLPLAGGSTALALQNLSCGYYLLYFPPFLAAYCLYEMTRRRLLGQWRVWLALAASVAAVALITWPFVEPYLALRAGGEIGVRSAADVRSFSADVWSFGNASPGLRLWRDRLAAFPKAEGEGFPGLMIVALAAVAVLHAVWRRASAVIGQPQPAVALVIALSAAVVLAVSGTIGLWLLAASGLRLPVGDTVYVYYNPAPALAVAVGSALVLLTTLRFTQRAPTPTRQPVLFFGCAFAAAAVLSFGPIVMSAGKPMMPGPFALLLAYVPGFDGGRVPARFLMLAALFLSVLAGIGATALHRSLSRRLRFAALGLAAAIILAESWVAPLAMNVPAWVPAELIAPTGLHTGRAVPPLYRVIETLPDPVVLIEFPFGEPAHDIHAMFYAGRHRRALVNGYSGYLPQSFTRRVGRLWDPTDDPVRAAGWLVDTGATHALVHEAYYAGDRGQAVSAWLIGLGARPVTSDGPDKLFQLK